MGNEKEKKKKSGPDHLIVFCWHPMASFDSGPLIAIVTENQLHQVLGESSDVEKNV